MFDKYYFLNIILLEWHMKYKNKLIDEWPLRWQNGPCKYRISRNCKRMKAQIAVLWIREIFPSPDGLTDLGCQSTLSITDQKKKISTIH